MKLAKSQVALLELLGSGGQPAWNAYDASEQLIQMRLVSVHFGRYGDRKLSLTDEGRSVLKEIIAIKKKKK